jgi:hypothetical protein
MSTSPTSVSRDVYTNFYLENASLHDDCVHLSELDFNRWFSNSTGLMAVKIYNDNEEFRVCSVGAPHTNSNEFVYIPQHITEDLQTMDYGNEHVWVEPITEDIPSATKLVLKPYNSSFFEFDTNDILREELDKYYVIQKGITLKVHVYGVDHLVYIEDIEPAPIVKLGGEVNIEFDLELCSGPNRPGFLSQGEFREPIIDDMDDIDRVDTPMPYSTASAIQEDTSVMDSIVADLQTALPLPEPVQQTLPDMWFSQQPLVQQQSQQPQQKSKEELRAARLKFYEKHKQQQEQKQQT